MARHSFDLSRAIDLDFLLIVNPEAGELFWRERPYFLFENEKHARQWNDRYAGERAFTASCVNGYLSGRIFRKTHYAHRVIWAMTHREWPHLQIDHINGNRSDNRISNLRLVTNQQNSMNSANRRNNTSGVCGVSKNKRNGKWVASITINRRGIYLGAYHDFDEAVIAKKEAENRLGFHHNHGRKNQFDYCDNRGGK